MDLLAGYGSGSESESDSDVRGAANGHAPGRGQAIASDPATAATAVPKPGGLFSSLPRAVNQPAAGKAPSPGLPAGFFDSLPSASSAQEPPSGVPEGFFDAPSAAAAAAGPQNSQGGHQSGSGSAAGGDGPLFSKLPAASKRKVLLRPQIDLQMLAQQSDSDDDEPVAKKIKATAVKAGKPSILSFLPAPKNAAGKRMDLGSGSADGAGTSDSFAAAAQQRQQQRQQQHQQQEVAAAAPRAPVGNEAYRLRPAAAAAPAQYEDYQQQHYGQHAYQYAPQDYAAGAASRQQQQQQQYQQLPPEEAFLQEALQAEASKAARRAAGGGSSQLLMPDIQFKEVKADEVKYVDPAQREAAQGMRSALGTDYAQQLRAQAAPHTGSKLARSKHQIGTLYANAKLRELEVLENRASGMKTKAETAGKYGW